MKKTLLFSGAVIVLLSAGCRPEIAEGVYGAEEQQWYEFIRSSYPGYRPPRIASPAVADKAAPEALAQQRTAAAAESSAVVEVQNPADDAAAASKVDAAADKTAAQTGSKNAEAENVKAEDKKADAKDAKDVKAEDKKADAKDAKAAEDKKADAKDAKDAEDKKADAKDAKAADGEADYVIYKVQPGDTPGSIARKFYGKASMYEVIMKANPQITNPKLIQIGTELKVPKL